MRTYWNHQRPNWSIAGRTVAGIAVALWLAGCSAPVGAQAPETKPAQPTAAKAAEAKPAEAPPADDTNPHLWKSQTKSVAVFKNGLGFFMREGEVGLRDGWCVAQQIPPATFGTLAIYSFDKQETVDVVGSGPGEIVEFDGRDAPKDLAAKRARLEASKNLKVQLAYTEKGNDRSATGKLVSIGPDFAVLESPSNSFAVPLAGISRMQVLELPLRVHVASEAAKQPEKSKLGMAYLSKGIAWIPEYTLEVLDEETAQLTLRGTLANEAEDLIHCDVHFVVGVPHFTHTDFMAPIAVGQVIRTIGAAVAPAQVQSQIMNRAAIASNSIASPQFDQPVVERAANAPGDVNAVLGNLPQLGGAAATDYTVYTKKDLTVRRGEKAIVTLFTKKIKYSHIYRWTLPEAMEHSLVLQNSTDTAWTTGPCLAVSAGRPLSEDLLKYTPKGGNGEIPVTAAINIANETSEVETDRKLKTYTPTKDVNFDLVTLEGKIKLRNFEKRPVELIITVPVPGKPISADNDGVLAADSTKLQLRERTGTVRWRLGLKSGEERTLGYKYERYVPSN
ncbi:MAG: hypothetical protein ACYC35_05000 [Pirellulales bacterium]